MNTSLNPDFHMHSCFSDGSDTPETLLDAVRQSGIDAFSLTDHDCFEGCAAVRALLQPGDPAFIPGIEFSCEDETGKYHILGYCCDPSKSAMPDAVRRTHAARVEKAENRFRYLASLGFTFPEEDVRKTMALPNPGKPHFAAMLAKYGYAADLQEGFRIISRYPETEYKLTPKEAIAVILQSDGIPVLAHGILADGFETLSEEEITARVRRLAAYGLRGLECFYSSYTDEQREIMLSLAREYGLLVTAGSDYHGKNKTVPIGETHITQPSLLEDFCCAAGILPE